MKRPIRRPIAVLAVIVVFFSCLDVPLTWAVQVVVPAMPTPGTMVTLSAPLVPAHLRGITVHPDNPLRFDFLIHQGQGQLSKAQKQSEYTKLIKYFLASLTIAAQDQWVNLSPYEQNRIIEDNFGQTEMGRDLLAQDYLLKQITSSLMYPESKLGHTFWNRIYQKAFQETGGTHVPVRTINKVWIIPDQALVYENGGTACIVKSHLKVMLEEDYLATQKHNKQVRSLNRTSPTNQMIRDIILPELEHEVNEGANFAQLRQIYSGMLLATWFKKALKESLLGKIYINQNKVQGVRQADTKANDAIYERYLQALKKGVFSYIRADRDPYSRQVVPRKFFAGGMLTYRTIDHRAVSRAMMTEAYQSTGLTVAGDSAMVDFEVVESEAEATLLNGVLGYIQKKAGQVRVAERRELESVIAEFKGQDYRLVMLQNGTYVTIQDLNPTKLRRLLEAERGIVALLPVKGRPVVFRDSAMAEPLYPEDLKENDEVLLEGANGVYVFKLRRQGTIPDPSSGRQVPTEVYEFVRKGGAYPTSFPKKYLPKMFTAKQDSIGDPKRLELIRQRALAIGLMKEGQNPDDLLKTMPSSLANIFRPTELEQVRAQWADAVDYTKFIVHRDLRARAKTVSELRSYADKIARLNKMGTVLKSMDHVEEFLEDYFGLSGESKYDARWEADFITYGHLLMGLVGARTGSVQQYQQKIYEAIHKLRKYPPTTKKNRAADARGVGLWALIATGKSIRELVGTKEKLYRWFSEADLDRIRQNKGVIVPNEPYEGDADQQPGLFYFDQEWTSIQHDSYDGEGMTLEFDAKKIFRGDSGIGRFDVAKFTFGLAYKPAINIDLKALTEKSRKELTQRQPELRKKASKGKRAADSGNSAQRSEGRPYGGIDLNTANLAMVIKRDGAGVPLPIGQQDLKELARLGGFAPIVREIRPFSASTLFSGSNK